LRALREAFVRANPSVEVDTQGYVREVTKNLLPTVRLADFEADLRARDGNELEGKFKAVHSSFALAVNVFTPFRARGNADLVVRLPHEVWQLSILHPLPHDCLRHGLMVASLHPRDRVVPLGVVSVPRDDALFA